MQVSLIEGNNILKVKVRAVDATTTQTYTIVVTRASSAITLVSNTGQTDAGSPSVGFSSVDSTTAIIAQPFTAGDNEDGYTLTAIEADLSNVDASDMPRVSIYTSSSGSPGTSLYVLTNPATLNGAVTFTAPAHSILEKQPQYFVVFEETTSSGEYFVTTESSDNEDTGKASEWRINDDRHQKIGSGNWQTETSELGIAVNGKITTVTPDATGQPEITGVPQVGQVLTAAKGTITDDDGVPSTFTYQWVRVDGGTENDIMGETNSTYTLVAAGEGKTIKVKMSFTDDGGTAEGPLTSAAYPASGTIRPKQGDCATDRPDSN